jgi:hypothetical protein
MENTISSNNGLALAPQQSAVQDASSSSSKLKLALIWLAVGLPLLWGAMKALEDIGNLPL